MPHQLVCFEIVHTVPKIDPDERLADAIDSMTKVEIALMVRSRESAELVEPFTSKLVRNGNSDQLIRTSP